jgi:hypothetical protein
VQVKNKCESYMSVGLQVWSRQVGLVRGTRWPAESCAGHMVVRTSRRSCVRFLVEPQNQGRGGTAVGPGEGKVMRGDWRDATPSPRGFQWFITKPIGYLAEPQSQGRRPKRCNIRPVGPVGQAGVTGDEHRSDQCAPRAYGDFEAEDTRRDRKACIESKQGAVAGHSSDGATTKIS